MEVIIIKKKSIWKNIGKNIASVFVLILSMHSLYCLDNPAIIEENPLCADSALYIEDTIDFKTDGDNNATNETPDISNALSDEAFYNEIADSDIEGLDKADMKEEQVCATPEGLEEDSETPFEGSGASDEVIGKLDEDGLPVEFIPHYLTALHGHKVQAGSQSLWYQSWNRSHRDRSILDI